MDMAGFYDAPLVLTSGALELCDSEALAAAYRAALAVGRKHALPVELRTPADDAAAVRIAKDAARDAGIAVNVAGTVRSAESAVDLAAAGADMLYASGFSGIDAMHAAARAMGAAKVPFALGVSSDAGGMPIAEIIARIDGDLASRPWHYLLDDLDPAQAEAALEGLFRAAPALAHRVVGLNARAGGRFESPDAFGRGVRECARNFGLHVLGPRESSATLLEVIASAARAEV